MTKTIEMVCAANLSRSAIAEAAASNYIIKHGLEHEFRAISSGIFVSMPYLERIGKMPEELLKLIIKRGLKEGFYTDEITMKAAEAALKEGNKHGLEHSVSLAFQCYVQEEKYLREKISKELGIEELKKTRDQTVPRKDVSTVFCAERKLVEPARQIYAEGNLSPEIHVLSEYVTGIPGSEIPGIDFNSGEDLYRKAATKLYEHVLMAMDKLKKSD